MTQIILKPGMTFGGAYRLEKLLGRGGMGEVWQARHILLGESRAIKIMLTNLAADPLIKERFIHGEAKNTLRLDRHPNIVRVFELGLHNDMPYIVMEYVEGSLEGATLKDYLATKQKLSLEEAGDALLQIAAGLDVAHRQGIVHRDIKPANILRSPNGQYKITDFGLVKDLENPNDLTMAGRAMGTPIYMSPEQAMGEESPASDIYALGVMLYEMLVGRPPFIGATVSLLMQHASTPPPPIYQFEAKLPAQINDVVLKALAKFPADRFSSALEMAQVYQRVLLSLNGDTAVVDISTVSRGANNTEAIATTFIPRFSGSVARTSSINKIPNNLPHHLTSFVGREREVAEVLRLLNDTRLLTLTGSGGSGKTRLAVQVATQLMVNYQDGVWFVDLAKLSDPSLVAQAVASALRIQGAAGSSLLDSLAYELEQKSSLIVLDNCEHLIESCAELVETLLYSCQELRIMATSRENLGISGETSWRVPSLSIPNPRDFTVNSPNWATLKDFEAVSLFMERAIAARPSFALDKSNAPAVAQVCYRLDGIPLAIELAAARVKSLSVEQIATRLNDRFQLLTGGSRNALPRQQTLRAMVDWSFELLSDKERGLLQRLAVFSGGWMLEAAEAICTGDEVAVNEVVDLLDQLVNKSLVVAEKITQGYIGEMRYRLLETIRQYAREKLELTPQLPDLRERHLNYFLQVSEEAETNYDGEEQLKWLDCLEIEHENLRSALTWIMEKDEAGRTKDENSNKSSELVRLTGTLWRFWQRRGYMTEARRWLGKAIEQGSEPNPLAPSPGTEGETIPDTELALAKVLLGAGSLAWMQDEYDQSGIYLEQALSIYRAAGKQRQCAITLVALARVARSTGDFEQNLALLEESLALYRQIADKKGIADTLTDLSFVRRLHGEMTQSIMLVKEAMRVWRELRDVRDGALDIFNSLWFVAQSQADYVRGLSIVEIGLAVLGTSPDKSTGIMTPDRTRELLEEAVNLLRKFNDKSSLVTAITLQGIAAIGQGDLNFARASLEEAQHINHEIGDKWAVAACSGLLGIGSLYAKDYLTAKEQFEEAFLVYKELEIQWGMGDTLNSLGWLESGQATYEEAINLHREALEHHQAINHEEGLIESLFGLALAYYKLGETDNAATVAGKAESLRQNLNLVDVAFLQLHQKALPELPLEQLKTESGWQIGTNMSLEEIVKRY